MTFSNCHPAVPALWFALVLSFTVTTFHPLLLGVALADLLAVVGTGWGSGPGQGGFCLCWCWPPSLTPCSATRG